MRNFIKGKLLKSLDTEQFRPSIAALCIHTIAAIEVPKNMWPDLMEKLTQKIRFPVTQEMLESSLCALCYLCEEEDIDASFFEASSFELLTAIRDILKQVSSEQIQLKALAVLDKAFKFSASFFQLANQRHYIIQVTILDQDQESVVHHTSQPFYPVDL